VSAGISLWGQRLLRVPGFLRARWMLRGARLGALVYVEGRLIADFMGRVEIGERSHFLSGVVPTELRCSRGAELVVGHHAGFNYGVSICASRSIRIGGRCMLGTLVRIRDDDGTRVAPVVVGDDVWIAHAAIIEPGVTIGDRAVVAAGSVVMSDVPAGTMAVGNPARNLSLRLRTGARGEHAEDALTGKED
jgi:maltose O-acetyltransferase